MESMKILQIVGFKNSGKTTLIKEWIQHCNRLEVGVIKHHGHRHSLTMPNVETDSMKFFSAGATCSIVSDDETIQLHQRQKNWTLEQLIDLAKFSEPDLLFIEGFKEANYPKVVIVRSEGDWRLLKDLSNIVLVLLHEHVMLNGVYSLLIHQTNEIHQWLTRWVGDDCHEVI